MTTSQLYEILRKKLPELTLLLKEKSSYLYHYYFSLSKTVLLAEATNEAYCPPSGTWPLTPVNATARMPCHQIDHFGYLQRRCEEQDGRAVWSDVDSHRCDNPSMAGEVVQLVVKVAFAPQTKTGKGMEVHDAIDILAEKINCDELREMTSLYWGEEKEVDNGKKRMKAAFTSVFKHCKVKEDTMEVTFMSREPITLQLVRSLFHLSPITSIHVLQEGLVVRNAFELVFSKTEIVECNPQMYLYCNRQDVVPSYFCSYRFRTTTQHRVYSPQEGLWLV